MKGTLFRRLRSSSALLVVAATIPVASTAYAQQQEQQPSVEEVVVTGTRIKQKEFTSAAPVQVISGETSREIGLFDTASILQDTTQASGTQIDNTFGGFVLDNGPGSATIGLRGLDPARTLVLLNSRRIAPAGVGGAPVAPDLNLIPSVMIERAEILLDGASTIYGSDAIAGVANVILRKDTDGFDSQMTYKMPESGGGQELTASLMWGTKTDKFSFQIGAELYDRNPQSYKQNPFVGSCDGLYYEDRDGNILTGDHSLGPQKSGVQNCDIFPLTNRVSIPVLWGSVYYTPGKSNTGPDATTPGIPNFSESTQFWGYAGLVPHWVQADFNGDGVFNSRDSALVDADGDGKQDFDFQDPFYAYGKSDYYNSGDFVSGLQRISVLSNGEYRFQDDNDTKVYFEGLFATRNSDVFKPGSQLFEFVPSNNPYNICNPSGLNGVDCFGVLGFGNAGPMEVRPIINIRGDRDQSDVKVNQFRIVGGVTGNMFSSGNWSYDVYAAYSRSHGTDRLTGINEPRLLQSLNAHVDGDGNVVCDDPKKGCVPVNLFASNIYQEGGGMLTDAEAAFLFSERKMETTVTQKVVSGYVTGDLFTLPWNDQAVPLVFGYEFRRDSISSDPNDVASKGLLWGWFSDQGAEGSRDLHEFFAETEVPLLRGVPMAQELTLKASGRWTDESYYSPAWTYSFSGIYRPIESLTFRGTYGTSYRAPNLRERFLKGTTGFNTLTDPCVVPEAARVGDLMDPSAPDTYDASKDNRLQRVMDSCVAQGVDPTSLGLDPEFFTDTSVEITTGGSTTLTEERSKAFTYGVVFEQPWFDSFTMKFAATYFSIKIHDGVAEPGAQFTVDRCYDNADEPTGTSSFCDRLSRDSEGRLVLLDATFVNLGQETSKGLDFNLFYQQDFAVGDKNLGVTVDLRATHQNERLYQILDDIDDYAGEPTYPRWKANALLALDYGNWGMNWNTRWIQGGHEAPGNFDRYGLPCYDMQSVVCRPVYYTKNYDVHDMSITWDNGDTNFAFGVRNVFDTAPSKVDGGGVFSERNMALGVGYDVFGRSFFLSLGKKF